MKFFQTSLVFLLTVCTLTTAVPLRGDAAPRRSHHKFLLGDKPTMDDTATKQSKRFSFTQTGGFAATNKKFETTFSDLSNDERGELQQLIDQSGLSSAKSVRKTTPGAADMFFYDFKFTTGKDEHHVSFDDGSLPPSYRPLVKFCSPKMADNRNK